MHNDGFWKLLWIPLTFIDYRAAIFYIAGVITGIYINKILKRLR